LKCKYKYCKLGGEVEKEIAIKDKGGYYHKECFAEKELKSEIESYYRENYNQNEPVQNIRTALVRYLYKNNYSAEYVMWCLKYLKPKINNFNGLIYTLSHKQNEKDFLKWKSRQTKLDFGEYADENYFEDVPKIEKKTDKGWNLW
jgi:hypothetical protein